jgi:hypothetical protein
MRTIAIAAAGLLFAALSAAAQEWPTKTVRIIVPFGPGSTPDMVGRLIADYLQQKLGQPFVIENRPGASANTGTDVVAKAEPDGYTIGISLGGPLAINTLLFAKMPYDPAKDLALITMLTRQPSALVVNAGLGVKSVGELVELLKKNPGKYNYGSIGNGSLSHLVMEALALKSGTQMVHIPYPGSPQAMTAVLRNDVQMACLPAISVTPHVRLRPGEDPGDLARSALRIDARPANPQGGRPRRRGRRLERPGRTGAHPRANHCKDSRRGGRGACRAGGPRKARYPVHGAGSRHARPVSCEDRRGPRALVAGHQGARLEDQLISN